MAMATISKHAQFIRSDFSEVGDTEESTEHKEREQEHLLI